MQVPFVIGFLHKGYTYFALHFCLIGILWYIFSLVQKKVEGIDE
jgi:hypothetical protein